MKNNILRLVIFFTTVSLSALTIFAQDFHRHEFAISGGGGLGTLKYDTSLGKQKNGTGGNIGLSYTFFVNKNFGISTGAEVAFYKAEFSCDGFDDEFLNKTDVSDFEVYEFYSQLKNVEEKQNATYLMIPLMGQFETGGKIKFYTQAGFKLGVPISGKAKTTIGNMTNKGYFTETGNWAETQEFMGFGSFDNVKNERDIDYKVVYNVSAELGAKWNLGNKCHLYTGAYIDYGLNRMVEKNDNRHYVRLESEANHVDVSAHSILDSSYVLEDNGSLKKFTDKVIPVSAGIKLRLSIAL